jgi:hypothetical protein
VTCLFESYAETALVFSASSRLTAGFNFAAIRNVAFQETAGVLVINFTYMIVTKLAYFTASWTLATPGRSIAARGCFGSSLHGL